MAGYENIYAQSVILTHIFNDMDSVLPFSFTETETEPRENREKKLREIKTERPCNKHHNV